MVVQLFAYLYFHGEHDSYHGETRKWVGSTKRTLNKEMLVSEGKSK